MIDAARIAEIYDTEHCPRCNERRLSGPTDFGDEGLRYWCSNCQHYWTVIELRRRNPTTSKWGDA